MITPSRKTLYLTTPVLLEPVSALALHSRLTLVGLVAAAAKPIGVLGGVISALLTLTAMLAELSLPDVS
jgi:hypothetical protein